MSSLKLFIAAFLTTNCMAFETFAQKGSASASVTIVHPIMVSNTEELSFNNVPVLPAPGNTRKRKNSLRSRITGSTSFSVTDDPNYIYSISLPQGPVTITNGKSKMTVENFSSSSAFSSQIQGVQNIRIKAMLRLGNKEANSNLTARSFDVTINYN